MVTARRTNHVDPARSRLRASCPRRSLGVAPAQVNDSSQRSHRHHSVQRIRQTGRARISAIHTRLLTERGARSLAPPNSMTCDDTDNLTRMQFDGGRRSSVHAHPKNVSLSARSSAAATSMSATAWTNADVIAHVGTSWASTARSATAGPRLAVGLLIGSLAAGATPQPPPTPWSPRPPEQAPVDTDGSAAGPSPHSSTVARSAPPTAACRWSPSQPRPPMSPCTTPGVGHMASHSLRSARSARPDSPAAAVRHAGRRASSLPDSATGGACCTPASIIANCDRHPDPRRLADGVVIAAGPTAGYGAVGQAAPRNDGTVTLYGHVNTWHGQPSASG